MLILFFATLQQISRSTTETLTQPTRSSGLKMDCLFLATYRLSLLDLSSRIRQTTFLLRNSPTVHLLRNIECQRFAGWTNVSVRPTRENAAPRSNVSRIRNKSSAIDPGPQVDVNWYAYNGETIAERDRATVALQKRPFDPIGRAHGWGKIGVKIVISLLSSYWFIRSSIQFVCFPFLSNQLEMMRSEEDERWLVQESKKKRRITLDLIQLRKGNYFNHVFIRFIRYRKLDDFFLSFFKRVNITIIFIYDESFLIIFARTNFCYWSFR